MITCPAGHDSESEDYCDTCGMPIAQDAPRSAPPVGPAAQAAPQQAPPAAAAIDCPNCATENVADALFCEACGYDFTTGTMPRPMVNPFATLPGDPEDRPVPTPQPTAASADESAAEAAPTPVHPVSAPEPDAAADPRNETEDDAPADDPDQPEPLQPPAPAEPTDDGQDVTAERDERDAAAAYPTPEVETPAPPTNAGQPTEPFVPGGFDTQTFESGPGADADAPTVPFEWVAEVWIDPDWYRQQEPPDPMPSPGLPEVVPLRRRSVLIGRPSKSRNITPDIDCESDPGASRRQAQLTTDGRRWFVEDLDSSNGTYVAGAAEALPDRPLRANSRHELDPDDRIYLGAWTRLVIRRATPEEHEAYG